MSDASSHLTPAQISSAKIAFAEIEVAARAYEADRTLIRETAMGTRARLLQLVRRHRAFAESIVPVVAARIAASSDPRASISMGLPGQRQRHHMPKQAVIEFLEMAPSTMLESLAPENEQEIGWTAVYVILAILECAINTERSAAISS